MDNNEQHDYERYLACRANYEDLENSQQDSLDKHMLALSGSSLAFSIAFVEKIVPLSQASWLWLLLFSWILLAIAIVCTISSFHASVLTCRDYREQIDANYKNGDFRSSRLVSKWEKKIELFNKTAYFSFVIGLIFLLLFLIINVV